jgi:hypothetical protein
MGWAFLFFLVVAVVCVVGAIGFRTRRVNFFFQPTAPVGMTPTQRPFAIKPPEHDDVFQCGPYRSVLARRWVMIWDYRDKAGRLHYQPGKENGNLMPVVSLTKRATLQEPADKTTAGVD